MGKKSKKKAAAVKGNSNAAASSILSPAAPPKPTPLDVSQLDDTHCAVCKDALALAPLTWKEDEFQVPSCCAKPICSACYKKACRQLGQARDRVDELKLERREQQASDGSTSDVVPELHSILSEVNTCPVCQSTWPRTDNAEIARRLRWAEAGHSMSQYNLGCSYKRAGNYRMAISWLTKAAAQGDGMAAAALGDIYHKGEGTVSCNYTKAKNWYEQPASQNNAVSLNGVGHMYRDGKGVPVDETRATELFRLSALQGYPPGILDYATMLYKQGKKKEALKWYEKGSVKEEWLRRFGGPVAQCQFSAARVLYDFRVEKPGALPRALFWARRSAKNGNMNATGLAQTLEQLTVLNCAYCEADGPQHQCSVCRAVSYCDRECQTSHWREGHKQECKQGLPKRLKKLTAKSCGHCGKENPKLQCSGCMVACYCTPECQKTDWKAAHRGECKSL